MDLVGFLVRHRRWRIARELLMLLNGTEIPATVRIGPDFQLVHRGVGAVLHPTTVIGARVQVFHRVTLGRADVDQPWHLSRMERIEVGDDAILCAGATILGGPGVTRVGNGTIVGANAVLTASTGEWEVWAGSPARKVGERER